MLDIYDESGNGMLRAGTSVDMKYLVDHYIRDSTAYVLTMEEKAVNVVTIDVSFSREGMWLDTMLRQILADIRQIPWDQTILTQKNYINFSGLDSYAVGKLQSLSALLSGYFCVEGEDADKQLAHLQEAAFLVGDDEWKKKHDVKLLRDIDQHFGMYPDARYAPRRPVMIEGIHTAKIETLLSALELCS